MAHIYNSQLDAYSLYHKVQEEHTPSTGPGLPALSHALAGSTGTAISNLTTYPLDLVITRLQVQRQLRKSSTTPESDEYKGVIDAFSHIYNKEGGLSAFYVGILQDTGKSIADSFLFFLFYNYLRTSRLQKHGSKATNLPVFDELAVGALAGACSKFFTTPISNIVTRKQTASMISSRSGSKSPEPSVSDIASSIRSEKGLQGFWSGYSASLVLTLNPSITFFLYETFKRSLLPQSKRDDPGARITFLMAAFSKAVASTITYPFSLAKARAQASSKPPVEPSSAQEIKSEIRTASDEKDQASALRAGKDAKAVAKRSTVFATILRIYRTEGLPALYEGIWGEILRGFFSHGITMLVKEAVHKAIIQLYYLILKTLNKYPSPGELATQAGDAMKDSYDRSGTALQDAGERAQGAVQDGYAYASEKSTQAYESAKDQLSSASERISTMGNNASEATGQLYSSAKEQIGSTGAAAGERVSTMGTSASEATGQLYNSAKQQVASTGKVAGERASTVGQNAGEVAKTANDFASKEAGHLLGNAQEMLGGKVGGAEPPPEAGGKGIMRDDGED